MKRFFKFAFIFLVCVSTIFGQAKKPSQKVVVEKTNGDRLTGLFVGGNTDSVTIEVSGANLQLKFDEIITLRFGEQPAQSTAPTASATSLTFEAAIVYLSGGAQPLARTEFILLDKSLDDILKDAGLTPMNGLGYAASFGFAVKGNGIAPQYTNFAQKSGTAIKPHIVSTVTSDFNGKGAFENIKPGDYWVLGYGQTRRGFAVWNLPVTVKAGSNHVVLDQKNAASAF